MKKFSFGVIAISGILCAAMASCTGSTTPPPAASGAPAAPAVSQAAPAPSQAAPAPSQAAPAPSQAQAAQPAAANPGQLPQAITAFISKNFPGATVVGIDPDSEYGGLEYDVTLNDGTKIDFDRNNQWKKVECYSKAVPATFVPAAIANYVKANYQSLPITKIDNKGYGYEIELSNGLDLKFDAGGKFVGIDD